MHIELRSVTYNAGSTVCLSPTAREDKLIATIKVMMDNVVCLIIQL